MTLLKEAFRSVWRGRTAYLACILLMGIGVAVFVAFHLLFANLSAAMNALYDNQRFGDAFASVAMIPDSGVERLREIPGVSAVTATNRTDARVTSLGDDRVITLRVASFDPADAGRLDDFLLVEGTLPAEGQFLLGESFAAAHGLHPGDSLTMVIERREAALQISGLVQSPEYVYAIPDGSQIMPDDSLFGFGYLDTAALGVLTGREGLYTNLSFLLAEGVGWSAVKAEAEELLAPYGLRSLYEREDQPSNAMLSQEIDSLGAMATSLPLSFILIAVIILTIMMRRIIEQERVQIGTLKAFGLGDAAILGHYLIYGGVTGVAGGLLGLLAGVGMTGGMTTLYLEFFSLPSIQVPPDPTILLESFLLGSVAGLFGAFMGARGILALDPAEAMRAKAPPAVHGDAVGRLPFLKAILASHGFMAVRNITRSPFRSGFVVVGVAFSFAITAMMASFTDMFDAMMLDQFTKVELFDVKLGLSAPVAYGGALESALRLPGVHAAEGMLELPAELTLANLSENIAITAIESDSSLYHLYDGEAKTRIPLPEGGLALTKNLADKLHAARGDILTVTTPYTGDDEYQIPVLTVFPSSLGQNAYMSLGGVWDLLDSPALASSVILRADDPALIRGALADADMVAAVTDQSQTRGVYESMLDTYASLLNMMQLAGMGIAFAIITNTASISLSERKREYATLRVLGLHPGEIARVVGFEYWLLSILSLPFGIAATRLLKQSMSGIVATDMFSLPVRTEPASYLSAALFCSLAVLLSNLLAGKKIAGFDMVEVLKERE